MQYKDVKKKIIVEEYLDAGSDKLPEDYKFYCMNGVCRTIMVCKDRKIGENEYVGVVRHRESAWLDTCDGEIRQLRRQDWTLTVF